MKIENIEPSISQELIRTQCETLKNETDSTFLMKCLDVLDRIMQVSSNDPQLQKHHAKWLQRSNFNAIIYNLQLHQNKEISKKAVAVVSYLDSDEDSDRDDFDEEDDDDINSSDGASHSSDIEERKFDGINQKYIDAAASESHNDDTQIIEERQVL